jgi:ABC-type lipoprotein export system ATPase subunit
MTDALVCCTRMSRVFGKGDNAIAAVHEVSCELASADAVALFGPSGSGKSTLLHLLAGLDRPTSGEIEWPALGHRLPLPPHSVGVVFQSPSLIPAIDVRDNVALPLLLAGADRASAAFAADEALTRVGLGALAARLPDELSGGQGQRVALARVLASRPRLILADEPTGQLDLETASHIVDVLLEVATELGAGLLVSTHDPAVADRFTRAWTMTDGRLMEASARW